MYICIGIPHKALLIWVWLLALGKVRHNNDQKDEDSSRKTSESCDGRSHNKRGIKQVEKQSLT